MIVGLIIGLFFIGIGFLVKSYPDLIAGYNTMPKEKKKNVDIVGLSTFMKRVSIVMGVSIIILSLFIEVFNLKEVAFFGALILITLAGLIILVIGAQYFDCNQKF